MNSMYMSVVWKCYSANILLCINNRELNTGPWTNLFVYAFVLFVFALTRVSSCVMPGGRTGWRLCGRAYTHMASVPCVFESVLSARPNGRTSTRNHPMCSGTVFLLRKVKKVKKWAAFLHSLSLFYILYISLSFVCLITESIHIFLYFQCFQCNHLQRLQCRYLI